MPRLPTCTPGSKGTAVGRRLMRPRWNERAVYGVCRRGRLPRRTGGVVRARLGVVAPRPESRRVWLAGRQNPGKSPPTSQPFLMSHPSFPCWSATRSAERAHPDDPYCPLRDTQRPSAGVVTQRVRSASTRGRVRRPRSRQRGVRSREPRRPRQLVRGDPPEGHVNRAPSPGSTCDRVPGGSVGAARV